MEDYRKIYKKAMGMDWDGRKYEIHHIDMNRSNNDITNLLLIPKSMHRRYHQLQKELDVFNERVFCISDFGVFNNMMQFEKEIKEYKKIKGFLSDLFQIHLYICTMEVDLRDLYFEKLKNLTS